VEAVTLLQSRRANLENRSAIRLVMSAAAKTHFKRRSRQFLTGVKLKN
jgi:hypothetical protein